MLALGVCNIVSSFVQSMPVSGALSRGAVNHSSGVRTTFGGIYTGIIVILSLHLFTPYFSYIPKASLAAVIIAAVVFMVEFHVVKPMWRTKKSDLIPACTTFVCCLFLRLEIGIVVGVGINLIFLLYATARPSVKVEKISVSPTKHSTVLFMTILGPSGVRLPPDHPGQELDFPFGGVRQDRGVESGSQAGFQFHSSGDRRSSHTGCRFHRRQGYQVADRGFPQTATTDSLLQPEAECDQHVPRCSAERLCLL
jgi:MFS superfamily sulfate permease-like transporter